MSRSRALELLLQMNREGYVRLSPGPRFSITQKGRAYLHTVLIPEISRDAS